MCIGDSGNNKTRTRKSPYRHPCRAHTTFRELYWKALLCYHIQLLYLICLLNLYTLSRADQITELTSLPAPCSFRILMRWWRNMEDLDANLASPKALTLTPYGPSTMTQTEQMGRMLRRRPWQPLVLVLVLVLGVAIILLFPSIRTQGCHSLGSVLPSKFCHPNAATPKWNLFYHLGGNGPWVRKKSGTVGNVLPPHCTVNQVHVLSQAR